MTIPKLRIGNLEARYPIIQGGMGIGISLHSLAGHVAKNGGIGVISGAQIGFREPDFKKNIIGANLRALQKEIQKARALAPNGIIGLNLMVAMKNYGDYVKEAVANGIDLIISGAGLPLELPALVKGSSTLIVPIVSSLKAARIIFKRWDLKDQCAPDAVIIEGPKAGGHLGFLEKDLENPPKLEELLHSIKTLAHEYGVKYNKSIPVIVAGGIYTGADVREALKYGADGVQMATRFVTTVECDAPMAFKEAYLSSTQDTIGIVKSPVGMPGRAILNHFITHTPGNKACLYQCIHKCDVKNIPYCISQALIHAAQGNTDSALIFCGSEAYKAKKIEHVSDIFDEIKASLN